MSKALRTTLAIAAAVALVAVTIWILLRPMLQAAPSDHYLRLVSTFGPFSCGGRSNRPFTHSGTQAPLHHGRKTTEVENEGQHLRRKIRFAFAREGCRGLHPG